MTSTRSGNASTIRSASTFASAVVHSANRTRTCGPGRLRSVAAVNVAWATSSGENPRAAALRSVSATIPARASAPRRTGGRSTTRVPAPCRPITYPASARRRYTARIVLGFTRRAAPSSRTGGSRVPGCMRPDSIW